MANVKLIEDYGDHKAGDQVWFPATVARGLKFKGIAKDITGKQEKKDDSEFPKESGAGWFELSNGNKIRGEEKAIEAEKALE